MMRRDSIEVTGAVTKGIMTRKRSLPRDEVAPSKKGMQLERKIHTLRVKAVGCRLGGELPQIAPMTIRICSNIQQRDRKSQGERQASTGSDLLEYSHRKTKIKDYRLTGMYTIILHLLPHNVQ